MMNSQELGIGNGRYFGSVRPSEHDVLFVAPPEHAPESPVGAVLEARVPMVASRFQPLPTPTGAPPYRLPLSSLLAADHMRRIAESQKLVFHAVGDTGGSVNDTYQREVARLMELDFRRPNVADVPSFFFQLGDVVYFKGEAANYYPQFYDAYEFYLVPIVAIPGNHDGEVNPGLPSLDAFVRNFCSASPVHSPDALHIRRHTMTQPNVYFTLETPLATIIGLYSNVPEGGAIDDRQFDWFVGELQHAPADRRCWSQCTIPVFGRHLPQRQSGHERPVRPGDRRLQSRPRHGAARPRAQLPAVHMDRSRPRGAGGRRGCRGLPQPAPRGPAAGAAPADPVYRRRCARGPRIVHRRPPRVPANRSDAATDHRQVLRRPPAPVETGPTGWICSTLTSPRIGWPATDPSH